MTISKEEELQKFVYQAVRENPQMRLEYEQVYGTKWESGTSSTQTHFALGYAAALRVKNEMMSFEKDPTTDPIPEGFFWETDSEVFIHDRHDRETTRAFHDYWVARKDDFPQKPDNCQICRGEKGGVKGNENVINGQIVCDYCHTNMAPK